MPRLRLPTVRAGTIIRQGIGKATILTCQRRATKGTSVRGAFTTQQWKAIPAGDVVTGGKFLVNQCDALVLFDSGASHFFVSSDFVSRHNFKAVTLDKGSYCISATANNISTNQVVLGQLWK